MYDFLFVFCNNTVLKNNRLGRLCTVILEIGWVKKVLIYVVCVAFTQYMNTS